MERPLQARVFLVGCSRSGTTLLQRCLAAHPRIRSFPETDFFGKAAGGWHSRLRARLGLVSPHRRRLALAALYRAAGKTTVMEREPDAGGRGFAGLVATFTTELDTIARESDASVWVEKTPKHFRYVDLIETTVPQSRFVHLVRDGREVVASLVDRARRYPEEFGKQRDPRYGVRLWNASIRQALRCRDRENHLVLAYEDFMEDPEAALRRLCDFVGLDYDPVMHEPDAVSAIVTETEAWKAGAHGPISRQPARFHDVLPARDRMCVVRSLDWRAYGQLFPHRELPR